MKVKSKLDLNKINCLIEQQAIKVLQSKQYEVKCPHCGKTVIVPVGYSPCVHCRKTIYLNLDINFNK